MDGAVLLFVRLDGKTIQIHARPDWSILQLKQQLYLQSDKPAEDLKVIFAGSELSNSVLLKNCQFTHGTVVHVIAVSNNRTQQGWQHNERIQHHFVTPTNFIAPTADGIRTQSEPRRERFHIFCKSQCNGVTAGKLRVRCKQCKDEAFEINVGPNSWEDVLTADKINGSCNSQACSGTKAEFYFKCGNHVTPVDETQQSSVPLALLRTNTQDIPCLACTDITDVVLVFPCADYHVICLECFSTYCRTKLDNRRFVLVDNIGYTLACPGLADSCDRAFIHEVHHFLIAGKEQYERFKNFATEEFVLQNGGILCPGEGCGNGLLLEGNSRKVVCHRSGSGCGLVFCRNCRLAYHDGECLTTRNKESTPIVNGYEVNRSNASQARWRDELNTRDIIQRTTKQCPGCKAATEKSGGCNHMSCARCQFQWCWLCLVEWGRNCEADHWFRAS